MGLLMQPQKGITTKSQNNTQNCQKIKLYGSLTTRDLKESFIQPHPYRWVGGRRGEEEQCGMETAAAAAAAAEWAPAVPHSRVVDKNREGYLGSKRSQPQLRVPEPGR